jgi:hypothetical protein
MLDSKENVDEFVERYRPETHRRLRLVTCIHSVSDIRYNYNYLVNLDVKITHEFMSKRSRPDSSSDMGAFS